MKALITGASSGIGRDIARILSNKGCDLILVSRDKENLKKLKDELNTNIEIIDMDLSNVDNCYKLYEMTKKEDLDILINNAGFGDIGLFTKTDIDKELSMINLNIKAVHILTKLYLKDLVKRDSGYILNVASSAAFQPGPLMATYYSTKSYVYNLTLALYEELKVKKSNVHISCLCPGPVNTNFNNVANCEFKVKSLSSEYVVKYAIDKMLAGKFIIIPGMQIKMLRFFENKNPNLILLGKELIGKKPLFELSAFISGIEIMEIDSSFTGDTNKTKEQFIAERYIMDSIEFYFDNKLIHASIEDEVFMEAVKKGDIKLFAHVRIPVDLRIEAFYDDKLDLVKKNYAITRVTGALIDPTDEERQMFLEEFEED